MNKVVIVSGARTAIGSFGGALKSVRTVDLGGAVIAAAVARAGCAPADVEAVIMGNVLSSGLGQNPARQAAFRAGLPKETDALTVNKVCGSGLEAVVRAAQSIAAGDADVVVAGGMENMSLAPYLLDKARFGYRVGGGELADVILRDGLWDGYDSCHMGVCAENLAVKYGITRAEQDIFAAASQQKCGRAMEAGRFREEIVPVTVTQPKADPVAFDTDEFPRPGTTPEKLAPLKPAFKRDGTVTAGNASGINDGAAAVAVMSAEKCRGLGLTPMAEIVAYASAGVEPSLMGIGPVLAVRKALERAGLDLARMDLFEQNEAFAVQSLAVSRELGWDMDKVNVNGGAIALGHPIGASGARILVTLLYEMKRRGAEYGLATLCIGGGQGIALIVKR